ncbi:MAG: hypothetical protein M1838_002992 [Thelocarpon superellum]|nr:MAG: hypothetical protein M1838_002992 [Thelocarpon superellum]
MSASTITESREEPQAPTQQSPLASQRANGHLPPPGAPAKTGRFGSFFPLGYKEGFSQWWANVSPAAAEHAVMSYVPHLQQPPTHTHTGKTITSRSTSTSSVNKDAVDAAAPVTTTSSTDPYGPRQWHSNLVQLSGRNRALNEFSIERVGEPVEDNLVMLHGYGAGLGFFYKNFEGLSRVPGWKIWALDMLGMGRSSRPPFKIRATEKEKKISETEDWFIDSLEEWRIQKKLDTFTLLGHSLGGYMAVAYALKYPGHLNKLVLASPVGIPEDPYAVNAAMPEPDESTMAREFTQDQDATVTSSDAAKAGDNNNFFNAKSNASKEAKEGQTGGVPARKPLPGWLTYLWDANISPFSIVRWGGPLGPRFVSGWTTRRFSHLPAEERQVMHTYSYSLFRQHGSGEYALAYVLAPGAFARSPLIRRIQGVGRQPLTEQRKEKGIPVVLMYGENDWMDVHGGYDAEKKIKAETAKCLEGATEAEKKADQGDAKVIIIKQAGHHLYLDGWEEFNEVIRGEMEDVRRRRLAMAAHTNGHA